MRVVDESYKSRSAYYLPRHGSWTVGGENQYAESNYIYHPVLNAVLNSVIVVSTKANVVIFNVSVRARTFSVPVHCSPAGNTRIEAEWDAAFFRRLRRVLLTCVDLKVGWAIEILEGFLHDAAREAMAARLQRAA